MDDMAPDDVGAEHSSNDQENGDDRMSREGGGDGKNGMHFFSSCYCFVGELFIGGAKLRSRDLLPKPYHSSMFLSNKV